MPKSTADNPFLICSLGSKLSEDIIVAKKFVPLNTRGKSIYEAISFLVKFLNSINDKSKLIIS